LATAGVAVVTGVVIAISATALVTTALVTTALIAAALVATLVRCWVGAAALLAAALVIAALLATALVIAALLAATTIGPTLIVAGVLTRLGIAATAALLAATTRPTTPRGNVQNLAGIDIVGILQPVDFSDVIRINPEHAADAEESVTPLDGVVSATAITTLLGSITLGRWGRVNGRDS